MNIILLMIVVNDIVDYFNFFGLSVYFDYFSRW